MTYDLLCDRVIVGCQWRAWRTQIMIDEMPSGADYALVIVMGRSPDERAKVSINEFPCEIWPGMILHAKVNTGAESVDDLCFSDWELR